jgi:acetate kinase
VNVLVVNAGSSSMKVTLLDGDDRVLGAREIEHGSVVGSWDSVDAVGHRIVHGGERFREAVLIEARVEKQLRELVDLAPLHQPKSLAALDAVTAALPGVPAVACFDTAFHATLPPAAATYALPREWRERWGLRRYGFHGLSHAWVARRTPELLGLDGARLRLVSCHLGAGASLCAINGGRSVDTTMGFTPLEGLVMATRSGSVDPGLVLWLLEHEQLTADELADTLEHRSGLLGLAGSADMREIIERALGGEQPAETALDVYIHRLRAGIAAMAASLGGLDALVFTGGVGEHAPEVRARAAAGLGFLGVVLEEERNRRTSADGEIGAADAAVRTLVLAAREDLEIARQVRALLAPQR